APPAGDHVLHHHHAVRAEGGEVLGVLALVDRESGGREAVEAEGCSVLALFSVSELLAAAGERV
ncbi:MAG TPA: hypothetical protein VHG28_24410, partial [Longimicrobiaceae bacterium]|nr:hypothetical protein [Longimicrobiaceae bacterium]